jgi:DNA-binding NarL/FixJ family response regulator
MTQAVLIEDHLLFREGLKCLLEDLRDVRVVGEAGEGRKGIQIVEKLKPGLVLLGLMLDRLDGFDVLRHLRSRTKLLVVSMRTDESFVVEAFLSGAHGYVVKADSFDELRKAIEAVLNNRRFVSAKLNAARITRLVDLARSIGPKRLTSREQQVLRLIAEGLTSQQAAECLSLSSRTIEMHRAHLMDKLGLQGTADLVRFAIRNRIIPA